MAHGRTLSFHLFGRQRRFSGSAVVFAAVIAGLITSAAWLLAGCGGFQAEIYATSSVAPLPGEDLSEPCV